MTRKIRWQNSLVGILLIISFMFGSLPIKGQELVSVSDITGGSSVFVFRNSSKSSPRKFVSSVKVKRTKAARIETTKKVTKQFVTIAKVEPRRPRTKTVDPNKLPPQVNTMPKAQASKLFAGVGEYYIDQENTEKAIEFFRESVTLDAKNGDAKKGLSEALALKGNTLLVDEKPDTAKAFFEESLKNNPNNAVAFFGLGEVYSALEKDDEAIVNYEKSLSLDKDLTEINVPLGILYYQKGEIAKADALLTRALASSPNDAETQYFLGLVRYAQNRNQESLTAFRQSLKTDPNNAELNFRIGQALERMDQNNEAIAAFNEAVKLKPQYFEAQFELGNLYYQSEKYADAVKSFEAAKRLKNDSIEVYVNLGDAYRQIPDYNMAESNYNLAITFIQRDPNFSKDETAEIYSNIGYVIGRQCEINMRKAVRCKWNTAINSLEKAVELSPNAADYTNLGWAYYSSARIDLASRNEAEAKPKLEKAKAALQKAVESNPKFVEAPLANLGSVYIDLGDYPAAIDTLKKVTDKRKDWAFANYALGVAYRKNNDILNAITAFSKAVDIDGNYIAALAGLGESQIRSKNKKEAQKVIDKLKKISSPDALREAQKLEVLTIQLK
ncbi:MAG TPA: tetratricopeptide repeat protein [Pyrinomonadaceae bacterium]|nr:tetratricopeptide repeat protein [Pyrinomonadaceae bacterium]